MAAGVVEVGEREAGGDRVERVHASMEEKLQKWRAWVQPLHARGPASPACLPLLGRARELRRLMSSDTSVRACLARAALPAGAQPAQQGAKQGSVSHEPKGFCAIFC